MLKTIHLTGKDETDLNNKQLDWQMSANVVIVEVHPDEALPPTELEDRVLRRIDYYYRAPR